jgi:hypothetical protein
MKAVWSQSNSSLRSTTIQIVPVSGYSPTTIAQTLMNILGTRLHHNTALTPHFSAMKLNGIVTMKSEMNGISTHGYSYSTKLIRDIPSTTLIVSIVPCSHASFLCTALILHIISGIEPSGCITDTLCF